LLKEKLLPFGTLTDVALVNKLSLNLPQGRQTALVNGLLQALANEGARVFNLFSPFSRKRPNASWIF
jgi:hypothetical protein